MEIPYKSGVSKVMGVPQSRWFIVENIIEMDDLGMPAFMETPKYEWQSPASPANYVHRTSEWGFGG